jgi:hypothetical protein
MKNKKLLPGLIAILFLAMLVPITNAEEITIERHQEIVMPCPVGQKIMLAFTLGNETEFAFDNFTITEFNLNISSSSLLDVEISEAIIGADLNTSYLSIWQGQGVSCELTEDDLYSGDEVIGASYFNWTYTNSTHEFREYRYYIILVPYFLIEIENIGHETTYVSIDGSMTVETYGDRENTIEIYPRSNIIIETTTPNTIPIITNTDPINTTEPVPTKEYFRIEKVWFEKLLLGIIMITAAVTALVMIGIQSRMST